jgi:hypothetical protein
MGTTNHLTDAASRIAGYILSAEAAATAEERAAAYWDAHDLAKALAEDARRQAWRAEGIAQAERQERDAAEEAAADAAIAEAAQ